MKFKKIFSLGIGMVIALNVNAVFPSNNSDFRNHSWGDNITQVIKSETMKNQTKKTDYLGTTLIYKNSDGFFIYYFNKSGKLYQVTYVYTNKLYSNVASFNSIKSTFNNIYGNCNNKSDLKWITKNKKYTKSNYDKAVSNGDLEFNQKWNYGNTIIELDLVEDSKIEYLGINYLYNSDVDNIESTPSPTPMPTLIPMQTPIPTPIPTNTPNNSTSNQQAYDNEYKLLTMQYETTKKDLTDKASRAYENALGNSKDGQINSYVKTEAEKAQQPYLDLLKQLEKTYLNAIDDLKKHYGISN